MSFMSCPRSAARPQRAGVAAEPLSPLFRVGWDSLSLLGASPAGSHPGPQHLWGRLRVPQFPLVPSTRGQTPAGLGSPVLVLSLAGLRSCSLPAVPLRDFEPGHESLTIKIGSPASVALPRQVSSRRGEPELPGSLPIGALKRFPSNLRGSWRSRGCLRADSGLPRAQLVAREQLVTQQIHLLTRSPPRLSLPQPSCEARLPLRRLLHPSRGSRAPRQPPSRAAGRGCAKGTGEQGLYIPISGPARDYTSSSS